MIEWARIVGFQWDDGNARKSADTHGVEQIEAEEIFFNEPLLVVEDERHSASEPRFHALGVTSAGRRLHITFTIRAEGARLRVISARDMSAKERMHHGQAR
jgi:uncharacterized DUF497 family protein